MAGGAGPFSAEQVVTRPLRGRHHLFSNQIGGGARIPEVSAKESALDGVVLKYGEKRRVRVPLRRPLARTIVNGSGVRHHRQIDRRYRSAISGVRHVTKTAGNILLD